MIYGYARVSSLNQKLDTQIKELEDFGVDIIISEKVSGVSSKKNKLDELFKTLKSEDTLVVTRMDRLGRSTVQLLQLVDELEEKNVRFIILNLGIDTISATGKLFLTIISAFSELERTMIKEKQRAGIQLAKEKGVYKGRPKEYSLNRPKIKHAIELRKNTSKTVKEISEVTNVSEATLYRRFDEYKKMNERT